MVTSLSFREFIVFFYIKWQDHLDTLHPLTQEINGFPMGKFFLFFRALSVFQDPQLTIYCSLHAEARKKRELYQIVNRTESIDVLILDCLDIQ